MEEHNLRDNKNREFKGVWIPKEIWFNRDLNALEKHILIEIDSLDTKSGCIASNEYLAMFCGCSISKVAHAISKLIELNYLWVESFDGRIRKVHSTLSHPKPSNLDVENEKQPCKVCKADLQKVMPINNNIDTSIPDNILSNTSKDILSNTLPDIDCEQQAVAKPKSSKNISFYKKSSGKKSILGDNENITFKQQEKELISRARAREPIPDEHKSKKEIKRESYLRKATEIATEILKLSEPEKIKLIKDWLATLYDKGLTSTTQPRFKYVIDEIQETMNKYSWEIFTTIIKDAITANHSTLRYVIQNRNSSRYNKQTLSDRIKFPGMKEDESVDEYIGRTKEIEEERQKALAEITEAEKDDSRPWY